MQLKSVKIAGAAACAAVLAAIIAIIIGGGSDGDSRPDAPLTDSRTSLPDTLRVVTLWGPTSYFTYRDEPMGFDYDMVSRYAADNGMALKLKVASDIPQMIKMLRAGEVDLIAYDVPRINEYRKGLEFCGHRTITHQVAVQRKDSAANDVTRLIGRTVFVEKGSKYQYRLQNLNDELGGGIGIEAVVSDTIGEPELIALVDAGDIPVTVTDSELAEISKQYYKNIDVSLAVSMDQVASWAVAQNDKALAESINKWAGQYSAGKEYADIHRKYFERFLRPAQENKADDAAASSDGPTPPGAAAAPKMRGDGTISPYDALFRRHAASIGWDWRELAAIGYNESRFNPNITSWAGAKGIMQLMPSSARHFGVADRITDPDANIYGAAKILESLDQSLRSKVPDPAERRKFVIASYNSGLGHILDAIALAKKHGRNSALWYGNVREMAMLKTKPEYYNDPVVKHGYFRAKETVDFVDRVLSTYETYRHNISP